MAIQQKKSTSVKQVAVITGGGTGIGAAIAERLVREGKSVAVVGRRQAPLEEIAHRIGAWPVVADMSQKTEAEQAIQEIVHHFGRIDIVVANAGGHGFSAVLHTSDEEWQSSLNANLNTAFVTVRAALPQLIEHHGNIVIVSSLAGLFAGPQVAGYTVGKHALIGLTRSLARDYGQYGIRVNALCPGWVRTPMADEEMDHFVASIGLAGGREAAYQRVTEHVPLRRPAEPHEIAGIVNFLASEEASYITGATIVADGGAHVVDLPTLAFAEMS